MKNLLVLVIISLLISCTSSSTSSVASDDASSNVVYKILEPNAFMEKMAATNNAILVDVRTPDEFVNGTINNSVNFNFYNENFKGQLESLDNSKPIFLFCAKGGRSGKASDICKTLGFKEIYDMKGGYTAYLANYSAK